MKKWKEKRLFRLPCHGSYQSHGSQGPKLGITGEKPSRNHFQLNRDREVVAVAALSVFLFPAEAPGAVIAITWLRQGVHRVGGRGIASEILRAGDGGAEQNE